MKPCVLGLVHHTHPTAAELFDNAVVRDGLINQLEKAPTLWPEMVGPATQGSQNKGVGCLWRPILFAYPSSHLAIGRSLGSYPSRSAWACSRLVGEVGRKVPSLVIVVVHLPDDLTLVIRDQHLDP
jgi:hypothetical protein